MLRSAFIFVCVLSVAASAQAQEKGQEKKAAKDAELGKKETSIAPDKSLAGDVTRKKTKQENAPTLQYDTFRLGVESQVNTKRKEQIEDLKKIIELSSDLKERPKLLFRLGELYWEESKFYFFEANRKDDEYIKAMNANDKAGMERAKADKEAKIEESKGQAKLAVDQYSEIIQKHKDFDRNDEVLYFLGQNLMEMGDEKKSLVAYKRLIEKYPKSKYLPDAHLAFGEFYFNSSKAKRDLIERALTSYKEAAKFPDNAVYGYALYKQGWCYFNLGDYEKAMDMYKAVILFGEIAGTEEVEGKKGGKGNRQGLVKEARNDFVRSYARLLTGTPTEGRERFSKLAKAPDDMRTMMKQLASLYYEDGKDKEAALAFDMLIKERPTAPEAPGFQGKIIDCVMRAGNKQMTVQQVRRLVKVMDDVKAANKNCSEDAKCKGPMEEAKELSERTISNLAVNWHNEGKKTRDEPTFEFANQVYADYMALFPDSPKSYDLRFFWAELLNDNLNKYDKSAEQYTAVVMMDIAKGDKCHAPPELDEKGKPKNVPCKYLVNAAYNSILAFDEVVKKDATIKPPVLVDPTKKLDIPPSKKALLEACERYIKYVPKGEKQVEIAYKAAKIYYDYNDLDQAVPRFAEIALKHPDYKFENGDKAGEIAANLVLDSYNLLGDWGKVNEWARKFYAEERLANGKFREDLAKLIEQSAFKLVNQLEARKDYGKAAEAYLGFVAEFPRSEIADKALFNASIDFFNAKMLDRAIETRKKIIENYKKSPYVPQTMYALAEGYEAIANFDGAADYYEIYAAAYEKSLAGSKKGAPKKAAPASKKGAKEAPKPSGDDAAKGEQVWEESKAQIALFNSGIFRDGLGVYRAALRDREKYLELWPDSKDAEAVFLSIVDLHERNNQWVKAQKQLEEFEKKYCMKDPNKMLTSEGRIASIYEDKLRNKGAARKIYDRILDYHEKLPKKIKGSLEIGALDPVARGHFIRNEDEWKKFEKLKLKWSKLTNIGELKTSILAKSKALEGIQKNYTATVGFKSADPAICALYKIGMAYDDFYKAMNGIVIPKGAPEDLQAEVHAQFAQESNPLKEKAAEAFVATVAKSQEFSIFNPCTIAALEKLRTEYKPEQYPKMGEDVMEMKLEGFKGQAIGDDLLTSIQLVPVSEGSGDLNAKTRDVGRDVADSKQARELEPSPVPRSSNTPPPPKKKEPVVDPTPKKKEPTAAEPDEPL
jgi:tetratricopeptide (TPR) repeat protein